MVQKFTGTIITKQPKAVPKLWEAKIDIGTYESGEKTYSSKISLWVPAPRQGTHIPGIFMRLSNPSGSAYTRMSLAEFTDLYTFIRSTYREAMDAFEKASQYSQLYAGAERALLDNIKNLENPQVSSNFDK